MAGLHEAREALAEAVTTAGLQCLPYPSDSLNAPIAFVDDIAVDFTPGSPGTGYFCLPGSATAVIVTLAQRHDREGATRFLEGLMPPVLEALYAVPGVRVASASSGQMNVGGQDLPAVTYTVGFLT